MFKPLVNPEILFGVLAHIVLNCVINPCCIRFIVATGEIFQRWAEFNFVAAPGEAVVRAGDDGRLAHPGDAAGGGNGGGGYSKKRHKYRVGGAVILIRGIPHYVAFSE